jgi:hypothetical protein
MINFRVRDLDAIALELQAAGIAVELDPQHYPNGRFARLHDPEGNPIELWQPAGPDASGIDPGQQELHEAVARRAVSTVRQGRIASLVPARKSRMLFLRPARGRFESDNHINHNASTSTTMAVRGSF